jgi:hypothetical protein
LELFTETAGSLVLSCIDLALGLFALLLTLAARSGAAFVLFAVVLPPFLLATLTYVALDRIREKRRAQVLAAFLLLLPTLAAEIWFYRGLDL